MLVIHFIAGSTEVLGYKICYNEHNSHTLSHLIHALPAHHDGVDVAAEVALRAVGRGGQDGGSGSELRRTDLLIVRLRRPASAITAVELEKMVIIDLRIIEFLLLIA